MIRQILVIMILSSAVMSAKVTHNFNLSIVPEILKGSLSNLYVNQWGELGITEVIEEINEINESMIWSLETTPKGILIGSGELGNLYYIDSQTREKKVISIGNGIISSIRYVSEDKVYVGLSKPSSLYEVSLLDFSFKKILDLETQYIWDMEISGNEIYLALGNQGELIKVSPSGDIESIFKEKENKNFLKVVIHDEAIYASTSKNGYLYRIDEMGAEVIYDAQNYDIVDFYFKENSLYLAATLIDEETKKQNGYVVKIDENKEMTPLLDINYVISVIKPYKGEILLGVSDIKTGLLLTFNKEKNKIKQLYSVAYEKANFISALSLREEAFFFISSSGKVFQSKDTRGIQGKYESHILDASMIANWGVISYKSTYPSMIQLYSRSGMTKDIRDFAWSDWELVEDDLKIKSPKGRYLQIRVDINEGNDQLRPILWNMNVFFSINYEYLRLGYIQMTQDKNLAASMGVNLGKDQLMITWDNQSETNKNISYKIEFKRSNKDQWRPLGNNLKSNYFLINKILFLEEEYDFKVTASTGYKDGEAVVEFKRYQIDNTPPFAELLYRQNDILRIKVSDMYGYITNFRYTFDRFLGDWYSLSPLDQVYDQKEEEFFINLDPDSDFQEIYLYMEDSRGNYRYEILEISQ